MLLAFATICAGIFFGAALYINLVEHPARMECGPQIALREFRPSYRRASVMQGSLAVAGCLTGIAGGWLARDTPAIVAAVLLGLVVPLTLLVIFPTNKRLLDPDTDATSPKTVELLARWNRLHAIRTILSGAAFIVFLWRFGGR